MSKLVRISIALALLTGLLGCGGKELPLHQQDPVAWESLRGQWVFINYWAEWCKPCVKEIPELNEFDRSNQQATVLGVYYDPIGADELTDLQQQFAVEYRLITQDPHELLGFPRPTVLPATAVFDPQGYLRQVLLGPQTQESLAVWLQQESSLQ